MSQERRERGEKRGERGAKAGGSERTSFSLSCLAAATSCSRCASMAARSCSACATACPACIASSSAFARFFRACRVVGNSRTEPHPHVPKQAKPRYKRVELVLGACGDSAGVTRTLGKRRAMQRWQTYSRRSASAPSPTEFAGCSTGQGSSNAGGRRYKKHGPSDLEQICDIPLNQPGNLWVPSRVQKRNEDATVTVARAGLNPPRTSRSVSSCVFTWSFKLFTSSFSSSRSSSAASRQQSRS